MGLCGYPLDFRPFRRNLNKTLTPGAPPRLATFEPEGLHEMVAIP